MDPYRVLNVSRTASLNDIKIAYRKLALKYHPDRNPTSKEDAERQFKNINSAYEMIGNNLKRREYDSTIGNRHSTWEPRKTDWSKSKQAQYTNQYTNKKTSPHQQQQYNTPYRPPSTNNVNFDAKMWNAWHYGDDAIQVDAVRQVKKEQKEQPQYENKHQQYYARKRERERNAVWEEHQQKAVDEKYQQADISSNLEKKRQERRYTTGSSSNNNGSNNNGSTTDESSSCIIS